MSASLALGASTGAMVELLATGWFRAQAYACRSELGRAAPLSLESNGVQRFASVGQWRLAQEICAWQQPGRRLEVQLDLAPPSPKQ